MELVVEMVRVDEDDPPGERLGPTESDTLSPVTDDGVEAAVRPTVPVSPKLATVNVELVDPPATKLEDPSGDAAIVKSGVTVTETAGLFVRVIDPLTPVTVIT